MKLFFWEAKNGNFGDDLNCWFWDRVMPGWREAHDDVTLVGIGTILQDKLLQNFRDRKVLILGSGAGYKPIQLPLPTAWDVRFVRGPSTVEALGLEARHGISDPAILLPDLYEPLVEAGTETIFIPHVSSVLRQNWGVICDDIGISYVSPETHAETVINRIRNARLVIAESMHAAIIADAFGVRWIPVRISSQFFAPKWLDWSRSLGFEVEIPYVFPGLHMTNKAIVKWSGGLLHLKGRRTAEQILARKKLKRVLTGGQSFLSDRAILQDKQTQMRRVIEDVRQAYGLA